MLNWFHLKFVGMQSWLHHLTPDQKHIISYSIAAALGLFLIGLLLGRAKKIVVFYNPSDIFDTGMTVALPFICAIIFQIADMNTKGTPYSIVKWLLIGFNTLFIGMQLHTWYVDNGRSIWKTTLAIYTKVVLNLLLIFFTMTALSSLKRRDKNGNLDIATIAESFLMLGFVYGMIRMVTFTSKDRKEISEEERRDKANLNRTFLTGFAERIQAIDDKMGEENKNKAA